MNQHNYELSLYVDPYVVYRSILHTFSLMMQTPHNCRLGRTCVRIITYMYSIINFSQKTNNIYSKKTCKPPENSAIQKIRKVQTYTNPSGKTSGLAFHVLTPSPMPL